MRLTEEMLQRQVNKHMAKCAACEEGDCDLPDRIEATFWNEVNRRIDEAKERDGSRDFHD